VSRFEKERAKREAKMIGIRFRSLLNYILEVLRRGDKRHIHTEERKRVERVFVANIMGFVKRQDP